MLAGPRGAVLRTAGSRLLACLCAQQGKVVLLPEETALLAISTEETVVLLFSYSWSYSGVGKRAKPNE